MILLGCDEWVLGRRRAGSDGEERKNSLELVGRFLLMNSGRLFCRSVRACS